MDTPETTLLGGRYRLGRRLGNGGMSDVHLGHDELLGRDVAIKLVRPDRVDGPAGVARLEREARATAGLSHPNIVVVHDVLREGEAAAIVMELVPGGTLADRLREDGALPWLEAVRVAREVASGLGAAHAAGLVHRDVKPSNVLLGPDDRVRVADFGIASAGTSSETTTIRGSIPYLAPEQARGDATDPRTDVYALGCALHHALTGRPPFDGGSGAATIGQHLHRPAPRPSELVAGLPPALDELVTRMLAKDPRDRPADMATVVRELDGLSARGDDATVVLPPAPTEPVDAAPGPSRSPGRRGGWVAAALVAVAVVGALAWQAARGDGMDEVPVEARPSASAPSTPDSSPSPTASTTPSPTPPSEPTPTTEPTPPPGPATVPEAATAFRQTLVAGRDAGEASAKAVEELDKLVSEIVQKADEGKPKEVRDKARELGDKVDELREKGELTSSGLADRLQDAAREILRAA